MMMIMMIFADDNDDDNDDNDNDDNDNDDNDNYYMIINKMKTII